jgi:hypothetical protein
MKFPIYSCLISLLASASALPATASAQDAAPTAQAIAGRFGKSKQISRTTKNGGHRDKYKVVQSEPAFRPDVRTYSGHYEVADGLSVIDVTVRSAQSITATGSDQVADHPELRRPFSLSNARIRDAVLTATKVFDDGRTQPFEGAFLDRVEFNGPSDRGIRTFGLGVTNAHFAVGGLNIDKVFYVAR